jgi:hypothetical protein
VGQRDAGHRKGAFKVKFAKGDLIRVQPWRGSSYGREAGFYLVLEGGLHQPTWAGAAYGSDEEWIKILRLETGQVRHDVAHAYEKVTEGQGESP